MGGGASRVALRQARDEDSDSVRAAGAIRNNGEVIIPHWLVDALPERLWAPGNLIVPRYGDAMLGHWHFCVGPGDDGRDSVRTVERNGRQVARGRRTFNFNAHDTQR